MEWLPTRFFNSEAPSFPYALVILNQPLNWAAFEAVAPSGTLANSIAATYKLIYFSKQYRMRRRRSEPLI